METNCPNCGGDLGYGKDENGNYTIPICQGGCKLDPDMAAGLRQVMELELVRPTTKRLVTSVFFDLPKEALTPAVLVDFEIHDKEDWLRLYYYIKSSRFSPMALDKALGNKDAIMDLTFTE